MAARVIDNIDMSSESSDEDLPTNWVPYAKRPEWGDVTPLEQDDGQNPVVAIAYSDNCKFYIFNSLRKRF